MKNKTLILTYDIGTTGNKCTIFDEKGRRLYSENVGHKTIYPKPGWSEQRPHDFWDSVVKGTENLLKKHEINPKSIAVIGLSGHMNGCIPVDGKGEVLFNNIIHSDSRSNDECKQILDVFDGKQIYNITGNRVDPHYTFPKILWIKNNYPDIYRKAAFFLNTKDYVGYRLTGNLGITDFSDASLTCMLDVNNRVWSEELVKGVGIEPSKLPRLMKAYDIAGTLTEEAASDLGLNTGIPVVVGGGDGACATKGAGVMKKGEAYNYIGSSSWISTLNDGPVLDPDARIFNFYDLDGVNCNVTGTVQSATISYDWVIENIGSYELEKSTLEQRSVFELIEEMACKSPVGSNGVFFLPYLMGERTPYWDKNTRGAFIGFTLYHSRTDLFRSVYEGISYALRSVLDVFEDNGLKVDTLTLIGGGAKSRLWNEIMCNVYKKTLRIHKFPGEATSLGAAIAAGVGVGIFKDFNDAGESIEYARSIDPDTVKMQQYDKYYSIYTMMYPSLKPVYDAISKL